MQTELRRALTRISEIREHMGKTEVFRGFRAMPVAVTGVLAIVVGIAQPLVVPNPMADFASYLWLWFGAAAVALLVRGGEMAVRYVRYETRWERERMRMAVGKFSPIVASGLLVTFALAVYAPESVWLLPGLWSILLAHGIFAAMHLLPRAVLGVGVFYLASGIVVIGLANGEHALSPLAMAIPFGLGQLYGAATLYWTLERRVAKSA